MQSDNTGDAPAARTFDEVVEATLAPTAEPTAEPTPEPTAVPAMTVSSAGIVDGTLADAYGKHGTQKKGGTPTLSPPLSVANVPEGTVCFAIVMLDPDSVPLCGYEWVHWLAANIKQGDLAENASIDAAATMVQGRNDFKKSGYGGPTPPDKAHNYVITVYALDTELDLTEGFDKDALLTAMNGHVLALATITAEYRK